MLNTVDDVAGRVPVVRVLAGHPVRACQLAPAHWGLGVNALLPEDRRAVSLPVREISPGIVPRSRVDL